MTIERDRLVNTLRPRSPAFDLNKGVYEQEEAHEDKEHEAEERKEQAPGPSIKDKIKYLKKELKEKGHSSAARKEIKKKLDSLKSEIKKSITESQNHLDTVEEVIHKSFKPGYSKKHIIADNETLESLLDMQQKNQLGRVFDFE